MGAMITPGAASCIAQITGMEQVSHAQELDRLSKPVNTAFVSKASSSNETCKCEYCGRTKQTATHKTCDGCGAPKHDSYRPGAFIKYKGNPPLICDYVYGWSVIKPEPHCKVV